MSEVYIGMGTCGLATGAEKVYEAVNAWGEENGHPIKITPTGCIGFCQVEPIMDVVTSEGNRISFGNVTEKNAGSILTAILKDKNYSFEGLLGQHNNGKAPLSGVPMLSDHPFFKKQVKYALRNCGVINPESLEDYKSRGGLKGLERVLSMARKEVLEEVTKSGLRGRGGAGFPTGKKWEFASINEADKKYVVCNADEGDPGAFMDRSLMEGDPFSVIEGMMIAGYAIGAQEGIVYCRAEYPIAIKRLNSAIETLKKQGILEKPVKDGFSFKMRIKKGAGAFVCGEETALLNSIEGKRGMPRPKPPFPAKSGLFESPTIINNVETFANVPHILREGWESFAKVGTATSKGTKVFALTGKVCNTGLVEVPMGTTLREIIFDIGGGIPGGKRFKAVQSGGPSGGCIPEKYLDTQIDYESLKEIGAMMGSGGLVVMDEETCMVGIAKFFLSFTTKESCGKCIPCREGTQRLYEILEYITTPYRKMSEEENLLRFNMIMNMENLATVIKDTSLCGLGQSAPNPVLSTLKYFRDEYEAHIYERKCPSKECKGLLTYKIDTNLCKGCTLCATKCPSEAIIGERKQAHYVIDERCIRCGSCIAACKFDAIKVS